MAMTNKQDVLQGFNMYQLGATTNKPSSEDDSDNEYEEYRYAFMEFDCRPLEKIWTVRRGSALT